MTLDAAGERATPAGLLVRGASAADRDAIWHILEPIVRAGETFAYDRTLGADEALARWMRTGADVFVAERDGAVVGTSYLKPNQEGGGRHVCNAGFATAAAAVGQGVARVLCAHALDAARSRGFRAMQFNFVVATNERAVRLWHGMGFTIVGRLPGAFDHPTLGFVDALVMTRRL